MPLIAAKAGAQAFSRRLSVQPTMKDTTSVKGAMPC
jgi:hypothetical protein